MTERTKAIMPVHLAGQPCRHGSDLGARDPGDRGRRARGRERLPRPQARRALRRDLLQPLRDEEHRGRRGRARLDELGRGRRRDPQPPADAPRRRLALRHHGPRLQGESLRRARGDRARPARQAARAHRRARAPVRALRRRARRPRRDRAARARPARHACAPPLRRPGRRRAASGSTRDEVQRALAAERISTSIHFLPGAPAHLVPRALPRAAVRCRSPSAPATRSSRCRSRPPTPTTTSRT